MSGLRLGLGVGLGGNAALGGPGVSISPTAYWPLNETSGARADIAGGRNLAPSALGVGSAAGKIGNAATFDGLTGYLATPDHASLDTTGSWSLSLWANVTDAASYRTLFAKSDLTHVEIQGFIDSADGGLRCRVWDSGVASFDQVLSAAAFPLAQWVHVVFQRNVAMATLELWINGVSQGDAAISITPGNTGSSLEFGRLAYAGVGRHMLGALDEVVWIKGSVLSAEGVAYTYNGGAGRALA